MEWVKGHGGSVGNKLADAVAGRGVVEGIKDEEFGFSRVENGTEGKDAEFGVETPLLDHSKYQQTACLPSSPVLGCQSTTYIGIDTNPTQSFRNPVSAGTHLEQQMNMIQFNIGARAARIRELKKARPTLGYRDNVDVEALLRHLRQEQSEAQMRLWKKSQEKWLHDYMAKGRNLGLVAPGTAYAVQDAKKGCWIRPGPRGFDVTCLSDVDGENEKKGCCLAQGEWVGDLLLSALR